MAESLQGSVAESRRGRPRRPGRAAATWGVAPLPGRTATLREIPVPGHCDRASSSKAGSPQSETARDKEENWSGEDLDNKHPDPGE